MAVVTGDTKVVEKGKGDGLFINTSGIGRVPPGINLSADQARPGDAIILSGSIGEHGITILSQREGLEFESPIASDCAALNTLVAAMLEASPAIRCMRDPTRGGVSSALNEIAAQSRVGMELDESAIPVQEAVRGACELLGLDPLYVANEGKAGGYRRFETRGSNSVRHAGASARCSRRGSSGGSPRPIRGW